MPKTFSREGQLHFCCLITSLVDDFAINRGILTLKNVNLVLFFFIRLTKDEMLLDWLVDKSGRLKELHWLQALNYLMSEDIFMVSKKSLMAQFLLERGGLCSYNDYRNVVTSMGRAIDPNISRKIKLCFPSSFCK